MLSLRRDKLPGRHPRKGDCLGPGWDKSKIKHIIFVFPFIVIFFCLCRRCCYLLLQLSRPQWLSTSYYLLLPE